MNVRLLSFVVGAATLAVLLWSCAASTAPGTTCTCTDTTQRHTGDLTASAGSPLCQITFGTRVSHRIGADSAYADVFAGAEKQAGVGGTTLSVGEVAIGSLRLGPGTSNGVTTYRYRGEVEDLPLRATAVVRTGGSAEDGIAPFETTMYSSGPLGVLYNGVAGSAVPDTIDTSQDLVLSWTPSDVQPALMRVIVEFRTNAGTVLLQTDFSGPDDGRETIPSEAYPELPPSSLAVVVYCERSYIRCACRSAMQYNLTSWSQQYLYRRMK